jgi:hypothetical protein
MKPLNYNDPTCNPISSNCVVWQGPDIPCLSLCKGDSVSEVIFKLATEVCTIVETLKLDNYDLSCFNLGVLTPTTFKNLVQVIVERICDLEKCTYDVDGNCPEPVIPPASDCPDCEVPVNPAFYYYNPQGDQVKSMQLVDYATTIGNKVATIQVQITIIQSTLAQHNQRIQALEIAPAPTFTLPTIPSICTIIPTGDMNVVLSSLVGQFCTLLSATGSSTEIYNNIGKQCLGLSGTPALATNTNMSGISGWSNNPANAAQSIGNLWLTLCDMRTAIRTIQINCCPAGCDGILINLFAEVIGNNLKLYFTGTLPADFVNCTGSTLFNITDSLGGVINIVVDIAGNMNNPTGVTIPLAGTPIDPTVNIVLSADPCFTNTTTGSVCKSCLEYNIIVDACCPDITLTPSSFDAVLYEFSTCSGAITYTIELWDAFTILQSAVYTTTGVETKNGAFNGLSSSTEYKVRITTTTGGTDHNCPFVAFTTNNQPCTAPSSATAILI